MTMTKRQLQRLTQECLRRINAAGHNPDGYAVVQTWLDSLTITGAERANIAESARRQITARPCDAKYLTVVS